MPADDYLDVPANGHDEHYLLANPMGPELGPELATWAAEQTERIRELRQQADDLEADIEGAFAAARVLMAR